MHYVLFVRHADKPTISIVLLALMALGAVCSPSSPMFRASELALQAKSAKVRTTCCSCSDLLLCADVTSHNADTFVCEQANYIITHKELKDVAIEAAELAGIERKHIYTMGKDDASKLKNVK